MCEQCVKVCERYIPDLDTRQRSNLLMGGTGFPYISPKQLEKQLRELSEMRGDLSADEFVKLACAEASDDLDRAMFQLRHDEWGGCWRC